MKLLEYRWGVSLEIAKRKRATRQKTFINKLRVLRSNNLYGFRP